MISKKNGRNRSNRKNRRNKRNRSNRRNRKACRQNDICLQALFFMTLCLYDTGRALYFPLSGALEPAGDRGRCGRLFPVLFLFLVRGELVFSDAAERTFEIIGKIFELGSGLDAGLEIAVVLVIDVSADATYKFCHNNSSIEIRINDWFFYNAMIE
jgi:hypothetical protein